MKDQNKEFIISSTTYTSKLMTKNRNILRIKRHIVKIFN